MSFVTPEPRDAKLTATSACSSGDLRRSPICREVVEADRMPGDVFASKARAGAYAALTFSAARAGDHAQALLLLAQELDLPPPTMCIVGTAAEGERAVVVVRGVDGNVQGSYESGRQRSADPPSVSAQLVAGLAGCARVQVMALAGLQTQTRFLPPAMAWSYATSARGRVTTHAKPSPAMRALVIANVTPPARLDLQPLSVQPYLGQPTRRSVTRLSGPCATPPMVLTAMKEANEIQFHTHALMDSGVSDASHLVLSPDVDGSYALTAEAIRQVRLPKRPIVVLAACNSAQSSRYAHKPWSLPDAFLAAGAQAVLAAATDVPDQEAGAFFTRVLARIHAGDEPAVALRDERMAALASNPSSWVADVILFE